MLKTRFKKFLCYTLSVAMVLSVCASITYFGGSAKAEATRPAYTSLQDCIAYFTFDNLTATDGLTSKVANGTKTAKATLTGSGLQASDDCITGNSLYFPNGDTSYLTIRNDDDSSLLEGHEELTISYWSRVPSSASDTGWLYFGMDRDSTPTDSNRNYIAMREQYNQIRPATSTVTNTSATTNMPYSVPSALQGKWKYVTVVMSATELTLYVNGEQVATRENDKALTSYLANSDLYIGYAGWAGGEYYQGYVDEFAVMSKAYTAAQVKSLYESFSYTAATPTPQPTLPPGTVKPIISDLSTIKDCIGYFTFDDLETDGLTSKVKNGTKTAKATVVGNELKVDDDSVSGRSLFMEDGIASHLTIKNDDNTSFLAGHDELTISYWSKVPTSGGATGWVYFGIDPNDDPANRNYIAMREKYAEVRPCTANGGNTSADCNLVWSSSTDVQGMWKYVTVVMTASNLTLYVNGQQVATRTNDKPISTYLANSEFYIGFGTWTAATGSYEYYYGYIDEFAVMSSAYSAAEVQTLFQAYDFTPPTPSPTPERTARPTRTPSATATPDVIDIDIPISTVAPVPTQDPNAPAQPTQVPAAQNPTQAPAGNQPDANKPADSGSEIGTTADIGGATYVVTSATDAELKAAKSKALKKVIIPAKVKINGKSYKVKSIAKKAFKGCKKLKTIIVKSKTLKKVGKAAFKGISKKAKFTFPKAKFKKYKKLFKGKGQKKSCKYKKK